MDVMVKGRNTTVPESLRQQAIEKFGRLDRYVELQHAEVKFWKEEANKGGGDKDFCEVTLRGQGHQVRCKVSAPDGFTAIDLAVAKLERQLRKLKTKVQKPQRTRIRPDLPPELVPDSLLEDVGPEPIYTIARAKTFDLDTMAPDAAALQMDLLDHDFYLFNNALTGRNAVVYRREQGDVGLIDITPPT